MFLRPCAGHVHESSFFLNLFVCSHGPHGREAAFKGINDKDAVPFKALRTVNRRKRQKLRLGPGRFHIGNAFIGRLKSQVGQQGPDILVALRDVLEHLEILLTLHVVIIPGPKDRAVIFQEAESLVSRRKLLIRALFEGLKKNTNRFRIPLVIRPEPMAGCSLSRSRQPTCENIVHDLLRCPRAHSVHEEQYPIPRDDIPRVFKDTKVRNDILYMGCFNEFEAAVLYKRNVRLRQLDFQVKRME